MNRCDKMLSILIVMMMAGGGLLVIGGAVFNDGDAFSTSDDTSLGAIPPSAIPVSNAADLARVGSNNQYPMPGGHIWSMSAYYYLTQDIILTGTNNHTPIGTAPAPFTGTFDGNGFKISGINIVKTGTGHSYLGIFGYTDGATIKNITVENISASGTSSTLGCVVGYALNSVIDNCANIGPVTSSLINNHGICSGKDTTVSNCYNIGNSTNTLTVGIASLQGGTISNCYNTGNITVNGASALGIGRAGTISNCYNTGNISSTTSENGIGISVTAAGIGSASLITNCYNTGNISASMTGNKYGDFSGATATGIASSGTGTISNCYNTGNITASTVGTVTGANPIAGGIAGSFKGSIINCYNTGSISTSSPLTNIIGYIMGGNPSNPGGSSYITNCYSAPSGLSVNGSPLLDNRLYTKTTAAGMNGNIVIDNGTSIPTRTTDQGSGVRTSVQMSPTLTNAQLNMSVFYTGTTGGVTGWDFVNTWTINNAVSPYPILRSIVPMIEITSYPNILSVLAGNQWSYEASAIGAGTTSGMMFSVSGGWSGLTFTGNILSGTAPALNVGETSRDYNITVKASRSGFPDATQSFTITVFAQTVSNAIPVPVIDISISGYAIVLDGSNSSDNVNVSWSLSDGFSANTIIAGRNVATSGVYTVTLSITNTHGTGTATKTFVVFDDTPIENAYRGLPYKTTIEVNSLTGLNLASTASWLSIQDSGTDPLTGKYYAVIYGVAPSASLGITYQNTLTATGTNILWSVKVNPAAGDTLASFEILSVSGGKVTVQNNSANAINFVWYLDADGDRTKTKSTWNPSGTETLTYTQSGTYRIELKAVGETTDYHSVPVIITISGGGSGSDADGDLQFTLLIAGLSVLIVGLCIIGIMLIGVRFPKQTAIGLIAIVIGIILMVV